MKKASLAAVAFGLFALAACNRGNPDQLNEAETNQAQNLDELSNQAANVAEESQALENQATQLNEQAQSLNASGAQTPADENIQGM